MKGNEIFQKLCGKSERYLKHNSSTILTLLGAVGVVGTTVLAVKATPKAMKLLEEAKKEKGEELTKLEVVKIAGPAYIPSVVVGTTTVACIFSANMLNKHHQAAITSAYALVDQSYKKYRGKLKELYGEEADIQIRDAIARDTIERNEDVSGYVPGMNSLTTQSGEKYLFFEDYRGNYFEATIEAVQNAEYHLNRNFSMRGYVTLNEFYEFLGLEPTKEGSVLGWDCSRLIEKYEATWIDFDHRLIKVTDDGLECYIIDFPILPEYLDDEFEDD